MDRRLNCALCGCNPDEDGEMVVAHVGRKEKGRAVLCSPCSEHLRRQKVDAAAYLGEIAHGKPHKSALVTGRRVWKE